MNSTEAIIAAFSGFLHPWHPEAVRRAIRANFRCEYCDRDFFASVDDYKTLQEDHIIPTSAGGSVDGNNIAIACLTCNCIIKKHWDLRTVYGNNLGLVRKTRIFEKALKCG
jgi:5-methylcytosine-specific restriction endonuclease McrA